MSTAEIQLDILNLIGLASHAFDGRDPKAFADLFAPDGVFIEVKNSRETVQSEGREAMEEFAASLMAGRGGDQPRHHVRNTIFMETAENKAVTRTYFLATNVPGEGRLAIVTATGVYEDEFVRTTDGWRMKKRRAVHD